MLTEVLLGEVPSQRYHTICHCPRTAAGAAEIAVLSTPGAAPGSSNASNIGAMLVSHTTEFRCVLKLPQADVPVPHMGTGQGGQGLRQIVSVLSLTWCS